jgi:hypothetical protein
MRIPFNWQWFIFKLKYSNLVSTTVQSREHGRNEVAEIAEENIKRKRFESLKRKEKLTWISNEHAVPTEK